MMKTRKTGSLETTNENLLDAVVSNSCLEGAHACHAHLLDVGRPHLKAFGVAPRLPLEHRHVDTHWHAAVVGQ